MFNESIVYSFLSKLFSLFCRKLSDGYTNNLTTLKRLLQGTKENCPEQVLPNKLPSLLVNSLLIVFLPRMMYQLFLRNRKFLDFQSKILLSLKISI